ncbi:MAG: pre-peptidase C-terminal domain-containing protein [Candidatus Promineifilaceae bacterium]
MSFPLSRPFARIAFLIGSLLLVTLIACRADGPQETPVPTIQAPSLLPQTVPITTLLRNPTSFEGQTIRVTGQYRSIPLLVCQETTHRSPATWTLVFGDVETYVAGFDEALRPLAASGLSLTIEGRWQKWKGPVGCGRRAPVQEIWYLAVSRIISPNPLVKSDSEDGGIVLVPSPTSIADLPTTPAGEETPSGPPTVGPTASLPAGNTTPIATLAPSPTFQSIPSPAPGATNTPLATSTPQPTTGASNTPTISATTTITPGGTAVTGTPSPTPSASATTAGSTPSATAEPSDQGDLSFDTVEKQTLTANSTHSWFFTPPADETITITAGSSLELNLSLELIAPDGTVVGKAADAGAGQPETITYTAPNPTGEYEVVVSGDNGTSGDYLLMLFDSESLPVVEIQDTLVYGSGGSGSTEEGVDHFWNFEGEAGDVITIEVSPGSSTGDLVLYLVDVDGILGDLISDTGVGGSESITAYTLPETGFYSIGIGEFDFAPIDYTMTLVQQSQ